MRRPPGWRPTRWSTSLRFQTTSRRDSATGESGIRQPIGMPTGCDRIAAAVSRSVVAAPVASIADGLAMMAGGEILGMALPRELVDGWLARNPAGGLRMVRTVPVLVPMAMAVRPDLPVLRDVLDAFIASRSPEQMAATRLNWFVAPPAESGALRGLLASGAGVALVGLAALGWARRRRAATPPGTR